MKPISYRNHSEWTLKYRWCWYYNAIGLCKGIWSIFWPLPSSWVQVEFICLGQALKAQQGGMKILQGLNYLKLFTEDVVWFPFHLIRVLLNQKSLLYPTITIL